jgi:hypothetical protein
MWQKHLDSQGTFKTFYFNAWENDDTEDPLLELIAEMESEVM